MSTLKIIKLQSGAFEHIDSIDGAFFLGRFNFKQEFNKAFLVEAYGAKRRQYSITEVEVFDFGGTAEPFTNWTDLINRLVDLGYTGIDTNSIPSGGGVWGSITGNIASQTDLQNELNTKLDKVTTSGVERAYIINADGSQGTKATTDFGGGTPSLQAVTDIGNSTTNEIFAGGFVSGASGFFGGILFNDGNLNETASLSSLATPINPRYYILPDKNGTIAIAEDTVSKVTTSGVERAYIINADGSQGTKATSELQNGTLVTNATVTGTYNLDFSKDTYELTLIGNTTLTVSNLPSGQTKTISVYITGNFSLAYPTGFTSRMVGTYNGTKNNLIVIEYRGTTNGYWVSIITAP